MKYCRIQIQLSALLRPTSTSPSFENASDGEERLRRTERERPKMNPASRIQPSQPATNSSVYHHPPPRSLSLPSSTSSVIQIPMLGPNLQVQPNRPLQNQQQGGPQQQQGPQQSEIPLPPQSGQDFTLASVLHFLQTEWRRYERDRNEWEIERAEMRVRVRALCHVSFASLIRAARIGSNSPTRGRTTVFRQCKTRLDASYQDAGVCVAC